MLQLANRGKQNLFLFEHMRFELGTQFGKDLFELRQLRMGLAVRVGHFGNHFRQPRQFTAQVRVMRLFDVIANLAERGVEANPPFAHLRSQ